MPRGSLWESCFPIWNLSWTTNPNTSTERRQWGRSHQILLLVTRCPQCPARTWEKNHIYVTNSWSTLYSPLKRRVLLHQHSPSLALGLRGAMAHATKGEEGERHRTAFHGFSALIRYLFNNCKKRTAQFLSSGSLEIWHPWHCILRGRKFLTSLAISVI